jgi:hypothetical protein
MWFSGRDLNQVPTEYGAKTSPIWPRLSVATCEWKAGMTHSDARQQSVLKWRPSHYEPCPLKQWGRVTAKINNETRKYKTTLILWLEGSQTSGRLPPLCLLGDRVPREKVLFFCCLFNDAVSIETYISSLETKWERRRVTEREKEGLIK